MKKMKNRWKQMIVWCMVAALLCVNCSFTSEAKTGSKVTVPKTSITAVRSRSVGHFLRTVHTCYPFLFSAPAFALV